MNRTVTARPVVTGLLTLTLLGGAASAASAAATDQEPASRTAVQPANQLISAKANDTTVKVWQEFRIKGKTKDVQPGYTVLLQQMQGKSWKSLPIATVVNRDGSYSMRVKLGLKGKNQLRTITGRYGTVASQPLTVVVR